MDCDPQQQVLAMFFIGWGGDLNKTIEVKYSLFTVQLIGQLPMCHERNISLLGASERSLNLGMGAHTNHYFTMLLSRTLHLQYLCQN